MTTYLLSWSSHGLWLLQHVAIVGLLNGLKYVLQQHQPLGLQLQRRLGDRQHVAGVIAIQL
jgi:hypothetical protein